MLERIGFADALLARETADGLELIDGHLRADLAPTTEVPVLVVDVDEDEARLLLATLDPLAGMAATDEEQLAALLAEVTIDQADLERHLVAFLASNGRKAGHTDPDALPERPVARTSPGQTWILGPHRLICGDATHSVAVGAALDGGLADLLWTDPPYGVGYVGKTPENLN